MKPRICVIGVYFGTLPNYFSLWLKSAEKNSTINFLIITDQTLLNLPSNVAVLPMTLENMRTIAEAKLGFRIALDRAYKCCDLKPAYGYIFSEYIKDYGYWAHCDFDMLFGDIRHFFELHKMSHYDKVLTLGHLSFYRNTDENNRRFMEQGSGCGNYIEVFSSTKSVAFDELNGIYKIYRENKFSMFEDRVYADISTKYNRFVLAKCDDNFKNQVFAWKDGKVFRYHVDQTGEINSTEYMYIHFSKRGNLFYQRECLQAEGIWVTPEGFYVMRNDMPIQEAIKTYNPYPGLLVETYETVKYEVEFLWFRVKRRFNSQKRRSCWNACARKKRN